MGDTAYARKAQVNKAIALEYIIRSEMPLLVAREASLDVRQSIAKRAGVKVPSDETWNLVCLLLEGQPLPEEYQ